MAERTAARYILSQRPALAQAVVARQYACQPELRQRYGDGGMAKCVQDTDYTLSYLAAALNYSSPAIFKGYIAWAKNVLEVRNFVLSFYFDMPPSSACYNPIDIRAFHEAHHRTGEPADLCESLDRPLNMPEMEVL